MQYNINTNIKANPEQHHQTRRTRAPDVGEAERHEVVDDPRLVAVAHGRDVRRGRGEEERGEGAERVDGDGEDQAHDVPLEDRLRVVAQVLDDLWIGEEGWWRGRIGERMQGGFESDCVCICRGGRGGGGGRGGRRTWTEEMATAATAQKPATALAEAVSNHHSAASGARSGDGAGASIFANQARFLTPTRAGGARAAPGAGPFRASRRSKASAARAARPGGHHNCFQRGSWIPPPPPPL